MSVCCMLGGIRTGRVLAFKKQLENLNRNINGVAKIKLPLYRNAKFVKTKLSAFLLDRSGQF